MGKHHFCAVIVAGSVFAACGGNDAKPDALIKIPDASIDAKIFLDAPPPSFDLSCLGNPVLTTATTTITLSGTVSEIGIDLISQMPTVTPLVGAAINACKGNCTGAANNLDATTSITGGVYTTAAITTTPANQSLDGYLRMTNTGDRTTYIYPPEPFRTDTPNIPILTFPNSLIALLPNVGITQDAGKAMLGIAVVDCAGMPVTDSANLVVTVLQGGNPVTGTTVVDASQLSPMGGGGYIIFNVPAGVTSIGATYKTTMQFLGHDVTTVAGATTTTMVRPGGYP